LAGTRAHAQPSDADARSRAALERYRHGLEHYNLAEYEAAIADFKDAYRLSAAPELLFNIAQAYRKQGPGSCAQARDFYRAYLRTAPGQKDAASVEAVIADMERCARTYAQPQTVAKAPVLAAPTPEPEPRHRWLAGSLIGGGLVVAAAGAGFLAWAHSEYDSIHDMGCAPACNPALVDRVRTRQTVAMVLLPAGGGVAAVGIAMWLFRRPDAGARAAWVAPTLGGVQAGLRF
jgi:hypothetical protein